MGDSLLQIQSLLPHYLWCHKFHLDSRAYTGPHHLLHSFPKCLLWGFFPPHQLFYQNTHYLRNLLLSQNYYLHLLKLMRIIQSVSDISNIKTFMLANIICNLDMLYIYQVLGRPFFVHESNKIYQQILVYISHIATIPCYKTFFKLAKKNMNFLFKLKIIQTKIS